MVAMAIRHDTLLTPSPLKSVKVKRHFYPSLANDRESEITLPSVLQHEVFLWRQDMHKGGLCNPQPET